MKRAPTHTRLFRCPLHHICNCQAGILIIEGPDWIQLDRCGEHNANSHDDDQSKYVKHEQIVAVADAVTVAPQQSASQLRCNLQLAESPTKHIEPLLLCCMQRIVYSRGVDAGGVDCLTLSSNCKALIRFGSLAQFSDVKWFRTLVDHHNDPEDDFHFNMYSALVIGLEPVPQKGTSQASQSSQVRRLYRRKIR